MCFVPCFISFVIIFNEFIFISTELSKVGSKENITIWDMKTN